MEVIPLGGGQEVGRSCIIVNINDKTIMFDCGMHLGYNDARKFPDFSYLSKTNNFNKVLDCVIISHFHLDHCGALPYLTEVLGYSGPVYMTYPTKALIPILLEDCQRILQMKSRDNCVYSVQDIKNCMKKIIAIDMKQTVTVSEGFTITPYYAGHVIGAAMFYVNVNGKGVVYTGDFSTQSDKHLGSAIIDCLRPDLMICESTYGSVVRDCRKSKERKFLQLVHNCIKRGGRVLIPIFALGRAQELCLLVETYWERMGLTTPVYFAGGLTEKANGIYRKFINYTNSSIKERFFDRNPFDFKYIRPYENNVENSEPCVIFSSPAMLHSGTSLKIFQNICEDVKNLVILPGYCLRGTIGEKVLNGFKEVNIYGKIRKINLQVANIAFSAHADTMGIMKIIKMCKPNQVMLVHGESKRMDKLSRQIIREMNIDVYKPANGTIFSVPLHKNIEVQIKKELLNGKINFTESSQEINLVFKIKKSKKIEAIECEEFLIKK